MRGGPLPPRTGARAHLRGDPTSKRKWAPPHQPRTSQAPSSRARRSFASARRRPSYRAPARRLATRRDHAARRDRAACRDRAALATAPPFATKPDSGEHQLSACREYPISLLKWPVCKASMLGAPHCVGFLSRASRRAPDNVLAHHDFVVPAARAAVQYRRRLARRAFSSAVRIGCGCQAYPPRVGCVWRDLFGFRKHGAVAPDT